MKHVSSMPMEMKKKMTVFSFSSDSSSLVKMRLSEMMTPAVPSGVGEVSPLGSMEIPGSGTPISSPPHGCDASRCGGATSGAFWGDEAGSWLAYAPPHPHPPPLAWHGSSGS